ncbi:uncharacterized protein LOC120458465 [Drosophila santomea]|uniref:uncharacterized protein LOC120458465 n=1 Tax=Drosophila santomea TaxID=129105 RepID=UPI0019548CBA|nr:uncharacterized protein LOC120458465 [Drosophila santomea]
MSDGQMDGWMDGRMDGWMDGCCLLVGLLEWMFALSLTIVVIVNVLASFCSSVCLVFFCGAFTTTTTITTTSSTTATTNNKNNKNNSNNRSFVFDPFNGPVHWRSPSIGHDIGNVRVGQLGPDALKKNLSMITWSIYRELFMCYQCGCKMQFKA